MILVWEEKSQSVFICHVLVTSEVSTAHYVSDRT